jgi:hypothetical protein
MQMTGFIDKAAFPADVREPADRLNRLICVCQGDKL